MSEVNSLQVELRIVSPVYAFVISLAACVIAAALEGACAGSDVKAYFDSLRLPRYSAPLWVWYFIGVVYYAIFFFVIFRTLRHGNDSALKYATLALVSMMMLVNAFWNYLFFRARNLAVSLVLASLFPVLDIGLLLCLVYLDSPAAWSLVPYLLYRVYALWWGYGLWKFNGGPA
jgi:translocator protein